MIITVEVPQFSDGESNWKIIMRSPMIFIEKPAFTQNQLGTINSKFSERESESVHMEPSVSARVWWIDAWIQTGFRWKKCKILNRLKMW
jgi:hypothetical protein